MRRLRYLIRRIPVLRSVAVFCMRVGRVAGVLMGTARATLLWLFRSREHTNLTYDLTEINKRYLASLIAIVTDVSYDEIATYIRELEADEELSAHIQRSVRESDDAFLMDSTVRFGRRLGWYALVRALKPGVVVETGVDKGLGSCVLTAALRRNLKDGYPGYYYGTDINLFAGSLFCGEYRKFGEILYGNSIASLQRLDISIDVFISDSEHSATYEEREYQAVAEKLSSHAVIVGDDALATDRLLDFALATDRQFLFFREVPRGHWYPGEGLGVAFRSRRE